MFQITCCKHIRGPNHNILYQVHDRFRGGWLNLELTGRILPDEFPGDDSPTLIAKSNIYHLCAMTIIANRLLCEISRWTCLAICCGEFSGVICPGFIRLSISEGDSDYIERIAPKFELLRLQLCPQNGHYVNPGCLESLLNLTVLGCFSIPHYSALILLPNTFRKFVLWKFS